MTPHPIAPGDRGRRDRPSFRRPALLAVLFALGALTPTLLPAQAPERPLRPDPATDLFRVAELAYQEALDAKDPELQKANFLAALRQFSRFLEFHGDHRDAEKAWYYSAVCHQKTGSAEEARSALRMVITKWQRGPLVGAAAFQLANHHYEQKEYAAAERLFVTAITQTENAPTRHLARYRRALCFQELGRIPDTIKALQRVLEDDDSPFRDRAEAALPHLFKQDGRPREALALFQQLAESEDKKTRADATLQAAILARDLEMPEVAAEWFEKILVTPGLDAHRGEAQLALMSEASQGGDHQRVVEVFRRGKFALKNDQEARRLLLAIKAYEALGQTAATSDLYRELERVAPEEQTALEAAYVLLSRQYQEPGPNFPAEASRFVKRYQKAFAADPRLHNARLMLGEVYFKAGSFRKAAEAYAAVDLQHLDRANHVGLRYRLATARINAGDRAGGIAALTDFLTHHFDDPRAANAYIKRSEAYAAAGDDTAALKDLESLLAITEDPTLREYAWAQKAGFYKKSKNYTLLIEAHRHLMTDFPGRDPGKNAASQFWTGWSLFRLDDFESAVKYFLEARKADPKSLGRDSTIHLALIYYTLQDQDALQAELNRLLEDHPRAGLPRSVFAWLGVKLSTSGRHEEAWTYLPKGVTFKAPDDTKTVAWRAYARSGVETGHFREALAPLEILLERDDHEFLRAESFYLRSRAHFGLKDLEAAQGSAEAGLELKPQGLLNAELRLILGDVALAGNDPQEAARHYVVVAELYSPDAATERLALQRAIDALEQVDSPESREEAARCRQRLEKEGNPPSGNHKD